MGVYFHLAEKCGLCRAFCYLLAALGSGLCRAEVTKVFRIYVIRHNFLLGGPFQMPVICARYPEKQSFYLKKLIPIESWKGGFVKSSLFFYAHPERAAKR